MKKKLDELSCDSCMFEWEGDKDDEYYCPCCEKEID